MFAVRLCTSSQGAGGEQGTKGEKGVKGEAGLPGQQGNPGRTGLVVSQDDTDTSLFFKFSNIRTFFVKVAPF